MTDHDATAERAATAALKAFRASYQRAQAAVEAVRAPQQAFDFATELRDMADEIVGHAATLRAKMAYRVYTSEEMSLASLAERISVSKSRADQFVRTARNAEKPIEDGSE